MFAAVVAAGLVSAAQPDYAPGYTLDQLVRMDRAQLEALYRAAEMGHTPDGVTSGRAIRNPGSRLTVPTSRVVRVLWQGKVFTDDGMMVNRVLGVRAVHARVYAGESWLDGRPAVIMDCAGASRLFPDVRDEIREVSPGVWLGVMYTRKPAGPEQTMFFALQARP
jgi:hypothetical protein